jgi:hypothetical protein
MSNLYIEGSKFTPKISLDASKRVIKFIGESYPENTFEFYSPVLDWLEKYFSIKSPLQTTIEFELIYFNSSSSKLFFDMFDIIEDAHKKGHNIVVNWYYKRGNENAEDGGRGYQEDFKSLNFNLIVK